MGHYIFFPNAIIINDTYLSCGAIMVIAGAATFLKVYKGSKNRFCYTMQLFTVAYGLTNISFFFSSTLRKPIQLPDRMHYFVNQKWVDTTQYLYYFLSLQSWLFATQYSEAALNTSLWKSTFTHERLKIIKWSVISLYTMVMLTLYFW